eukprot:TRINITY_DN8113_c0_g1_i6.p1 TRINITY_DN8113_c0_g1~~TRINITY_DN8113_c0_g1_i6.p1  ORF type:complete len:411 (-),score=101.61 TRINITY_DN8113_c0_g1_i6:148-1380(-)
MCIRDSFGYYAIRHDVTEASFLVRETFMRVFRAAIWTSAIVLFQKLFQSKTGKLPPKAEQSSSLRFCMHVWGYIVKASSFTLAWMWNDVMYFLALRVVFDCHEPYTRCGKYTIWINVGYAIAFTLLATVVLPLLKGKERLIKSLDGFYAKELMSNDSHLVKMESANNSLLNAMFGIMVGWSWTKIFAAECVEDATPSCPSSMDANKFIGFFACIVFYELIALLMFHRFMESRRLFQRAAKVSLLSEGDADRFFEDVDIDKDGRVTRKEIDTFMKSHDLNPQHFIVAFAKTDEMDGCVDGDADAKQLVSVFTTVMKEAEAGFTPRKKTLEIQPSLLYEPVKKKKKKKRPKSPEELVVELENKEKYKANFHRNDVEHCVTNHLSAQFGEDNPAALPVMGTRGQKHGRHVVGL